ncbi:MAG: chorismate mutase, partial [Rhodospirillaceae bacterium]|nr:chorismate mutase [Rhodospirillaceae bacterium]
MSHETSELAALRRDVDRIDDAIHDLLMERTEVVLRIGAQKRSAPSLPTDHFVATRPGREALILRRLLVRHQGAFPAEVVVRLWREMIGTLMRVQGPFTMAVFMPEGGAGYLEIARDHYGSYTETLSYQVAGRVLKTVVEGGAGVAVLPLPGQSVSEPWWPALIGDAHPRVYVIARLPFAGPGAGRGGEIEAFAVAPVMPEETGEDRSLLAVETNSSISRTQVSAKLANAGLTVLTYWDVRSFAPDA